MTQPSKEAVSKAQSLCNFFDWGKNSEQVREVALLCDSFAAARVTEERQAIAAALRSMGADAYANAIIQGGGK